jgi:hypothetical protein
LANSSLEISLEDDKNDRFIVSKNSIKNI